MKNKKLLGIGMVYKNRGKYVLIKGEIFPIKYLDTVCIYAKEGSPFLKRKIYVKKIYHYFEDV